MSRIIISLFALAAVFAASATDVVLKAPGSLASAIDDPAAVSTLTVSGPMDASDFFFIARNMPGLTALHLSEATIAGYKGTAIEGLSQYDANLIPRGVLAGSAIASLTLPGQEGLIIGEGAFAGTPVKTLTVPANVAAIGAGAFAVCPQLTQATIAAPEVGVGAFADCPKLARVTFSAPAAVDRAAFARCEALAAVDGSANITAIGPAAFMGCSALKNFAFGSKLTTVGERAFSRSALTKADLSACPANLTVGDWAFAEMPSLSSADFSRAASTGAGVVFNCPKLSAFAAAKTDSIADYAYTYNSSLGADGLLPAGIRVVGAHALHGLSQVSAITVPSSVEYIGDGAMEDMTGLQHITTESSNVPTLGTEVWRGVDQPSVTLHVPDGATDAYAAAEQWQNFTIADPAGVDEITDSDGSPAGLPGLKGRFAGHELQVSIAGELSISRLALHDLSGLLLLAVEPYDSFVAIDTTDLSGRIFLVSALLSDGRTASLKLAR